MSQSQGGNYRQGNGFGSFDNRDRQNNRDNRFGDRRTNRDENRESSNQQGKKTLFEERKNKMMSSGRQFDNDRGPQNRSGQNSQRFSNGPEKRTSFVPQVKTGQDEDDWGSTSDKNKVDLKLFILMTQFPYFCLCIQFNVFQETLLGCH